MCVREIGGTKVSSPCRALNMRSAAGSAEHRAGSSLKHKESTKAHAPFHRHTFYLTIKSSHSHA